jgi:hypothetical protein
MHCDDGVDYVVKLPVPNWPRSAFNEALCGRLAQETRIPIPDVVIVEIGRDLISASPPLVTRGVVPAKYYGCKYLPSAIDFADAKAGRLGPSNIENREQLAEILAFDHWVMNADLNHGNVIIEPVDTGSGLQFRAYLIDSGLALTGPSWSAPELRARMSSTDRTRPFPFMGDCILSEQEFIPLVNRVEVMTSTQIEAIEMEMPGEWGLSPEDIASVRDFLDGRRNILRQILLSPPPGWWRT